MSALKPWQAGASTSALPPRGMRDAVEVASKPLAAGVMSALRFCAMESSMEAREVRRKSAAARQLCVFIAAEKAQNRDGSVSRIPRRVPVEKQSWGVSTGCEEGALILCGSGPGGGAGVVPVPDQRRLATAIDGAASERLRIVYMQCGVCRWECGVHKNNFWGSAMTARPRARKFVSKRRLADKDGHDDGS